MKRKNITIVIAAIIIILTGCFATFYFKFVRHVEPDEKEWSHLMSDVDTAGMDFLIPVDTIDLNAPGAEYLPEKPNQPVEIEDDKIILDKEKLRYIVEDRINIMLDDDSLSITDFANEFKKLYPSWKYEIIYADPILKRLQIKVPADEREKIKEALEKQLPERFSGEKLIVWDEAVIKTDGQPNDTYIDKCWYHDAMNTFNAWDITQGSPDVVVAVLDDGFELMHEEFKGRVVKPMNVYDKSSDVHESAMQHGTHVAGLALAAVNNNCGIAGVAPKCKLMPVKVFDEYDNCGFTAIVDAVMYSIYQRADVVNLSLGMSLNMKISEQKQNEMIKTYYKAEERIWKRVFSMASRNHTTIVVSAGNDDMLAGIEPMQRSENVIVVAAVDENLNNLEKCDFSNYGRYADVSAPGNNIYSTVGRSKYEYMSGTSMAAPLVTGTVALMKSLDKSLTTTQIKRIIEHTGVSVKKGRIGPMIQIDKALECVKNNDLPPTPTTGSVQILLSWGNENDLDLICEDPSGEQIWYKHKRSRSGGILEIDMNAWEPYYSMPIENIYWPESGAPKGKYKVYVGYYDYHTSPVRTRYSVTVRYGDKEQVYNGVVEWPNDVNKVCEFDL